MVKYHHWLHGHESEQTPGDSEEQESLVLQRAGHDLVTEQQQQFKDQMQLREEVRAGTREGSFCL